MQGYQSDLKEKNSISDAKYERKQRFWSLPDNVDLSESANDLIEDVHFSRVQSSLGIDFMSPA